MGSHLLNAAVRDPTSITSQRLVLVFLSLLSAAVAAVAAAAAAVAVEMMQQKFRQLHLEGAKACAMRLSLVWHARAC